MTEITCLLAKAQMLAIQDPEEYARRVTHVANAITAQLGDMTPAEIAERVTTFLAESFVIAVAPGGIAKIALKLINSPIRLSSLNNCKIRFYGYQNEHLEQ